MFLRSKVVSLVSNPQPGGPGPCIYAPSDRVAQLCPQASSYLFVAFYDSQGYGGGILTGLHMTIVPIKDSFFQVKSNEDAGRMFLRNVIRFIEQEPWLHARKAELRVSLTPPPARVRLQHLVCGHRRLKRLFLNGSMYLHLQYYSYGVMTQKTTI
jgi:hypothetical protein